MFVHVMPIYLKFLQYGGVKYALLKLGDKSECWEHTVLPCGGQFNFPRPAK
jgi:hypothetical protein